VISPTEQINMLAEALVETGWVTTVCRNEPALNRVGQLLAITSSHEYTLHTVDGRELRWENASFVRIPGSAADNREIFLLGDQSDPTAASLGPSCSEIGAPQ
jgi:hypothetical protein